MARKLVIMGGPGDGMIVAAAAIAAAKAGGTDEPFGFLNDRMAKGEKVCGMPVLGTLDDWPRLPADTVFIPALHKVGDMPVRIQRIEGLRVPRERWATVRHPMTQIADDAAIGHGVLLASFVTVQPGARLGNFISVRPGAHVSHEVTVADYVYVGSNATLSGRSVIGRGAHIGPNAVLREGHEVGHFAIVGQGATVAQSVEAGATVAGNPARPLRPR